MSDEIEEKAAFKDAIAVAGVCGALMLVGVVAANSSLLGTVLAGPILGPLVGALCRATDTDHG